jgi:orotidine-5'-phosphate decarboxylase
MGFADSALQAVREKRSVVVVGLDPTLDRFPPSVQPKAPQPEAVSRALADFCRGIIDATKAAAVAVKAQIAFFERWGPPGLEALAEVARCAKENRLLVILDAKRGDIGSTAEAYASAYLDDSGLGPWVDAITVNPYLGADSLEPFLRRARDRGKGIFVLVRTSNPSAAQLQERPLAEGMPLYEAVAELVRQWGEEAVEAGGYSNVGAVVGATAPEQLRRVREILPYHWLLLPGYGAQGAGPLDVVAGFDKNGAGVLVNASRSIIYAWENRQDVDPDGEGYAEAAQQAAEEMRSAIAEAAARSAPPV